MKTIKPAVQELYELMFAMGRLLKHQMNVDGFGPSFYLHFETLRYLHESGDTDMRELAHYLRIAAPSATGLVDALVTDKLVVRKNDPADRRRVILAIAPAGLSMLKKAAQHRMRAFARVTAPLTAANQRELARILRIIIEHN